MTHLPRRTLILFVLLLSVTVAAAADADKTQRLTVPLTDPGRPVKLNASLFSGGLSVEAHESKEVIVEVLPAEPEPSERSGGMRVIPNRSLGLTVEELDNEVSLASDFSSRINRLIVKVPKKTSVSISTVNDGDIEVRGVEGELELNSTNGSITALDVAGSVVAHTTNGDVKVTFTSIQPGKSMSFVTFNGDVDVTFPPGLKADLRIKTGQGEIYTDFDFALVPVDSEMKTERSGKKYRVQLDQDVRARIEGGGAEMHFNTWNGDIFIRKRGGGSSGR
jgi:hypothetical protein